jgi:hypothetical protein
LTVISFWFGQFRQKSRAAPVKIEPGSALMNSLGIGLSANHRP